GCAGVTSWGITVAASATARDDHQPCETRRGGRHSDERGAATAATGVLCVAGSGGGHIAACAAAALPASAPWAALAARGRVCPTPADAYEQPFTGRDRERRRHCSASTTTKCAKDAVPAGRPDCLHCDARHTDRHDERVAIRRGKPGRRSRCRKRRSCVQPRR